MYSSGTFAFLFLLILANQKIGVKAAACNINYRSHTQEWEIDGTLYICKVSNVPYCRGGCAASVKYELHVSDSSSAKRRCSVDVNQCVSSGPVYLQKTLENCKYSINDTAASITASGWVVAALGCSCEVIYGSGVSADVCENTFSKLL